VEKNLLRGRVNTFVGVCVVISFAASAANAYPTIISDSPACIISSSANGDIDISACNLGSSVVNDRMAELAGVLLRPPSTDNRVTSGGNQYLPAVPPALLMVLTGFFCVSLIRDRRTWVAVLTGLLWVGQTGINALPELTSRMSRKVHNSRLIEPTLLAAYPRGGDYYPESFNEQTRYTGLLHHLEGIPRQTSVFTNNRVLLTRLYLSTANKDTRTSQHAIVMALSSLNTLCSCLVWPTRQFICFTPAFIFSNLSRGPPIS
jgi:hypothetical protein